MAVQYEDIRVLRAKGIIDEVWTAADIAPYVNDKYPNQTLANHSACPCHQEKGHHCKLNTNCRSGSTDSSNNSWDFK